MAVDAFGKSQPSYRTAFSGQQCAPQKLGVPRREEKLDAPDLVTWCPGCPERVRRLVDSCSYTHHTVLCLFHSSNQRGLLQVVDKTARLLRSQLLELHRPASRQHGLVKPSTVLDFALPSVVLEVDGGTGHTISRRRTRIRLWSGPILCE